MTQHPPAPGRQDAARATLDQPARSCHASRDTASEHAISIRAYTPEHALALLALVVHCRRIVQTHYMLCWLDQFQVGRSALAPAGLASAEAPTDGDAL